MLGILNLAVNNAKSGGIEDYAIICLCVSVSKGFPLASIL